MIYANELHARFGVDKNDDDGDNDGEGKDNDDDVIHTGVRAYKSGHHAKSSNCNKVRRKGDLGNLWVIFLSSKK